MIVPATMTIPILDKIPPNPPFTVAMTLSAGIPQIRPTKIEISTMTTKGCCLNLLIATIMMITARTMTAPINKPDIVIPPLHLKIPSYRPSRADNPPHVFFQPCPHRITGAMAQRHAAKPHRPEFRQSSINSLGGRLFKMCPSDDASHGKAEPLMDRFHHI